MFEKRKLLMKTAFEKAKKELRLDTTSDSAILDFLSQKIEDQFGSSMNTRTFIRYYKRLVRENRDYPIDEITLDHMSWYVGYENFEDFCQNYSIKRQHGDTNIEFKIGHDEESLSERLSKIIINITNAPVFGIPSVAKNGVGIGMLAVALFASFSYGGNGTIFENENKCMYWDGTEYKLTNCNDKNPKHKLVPVDTVRLKYFKRITKPDTLTVDNAFGNTFYSKYNNEVEFFTMDGINPNNGKSLRDATEHMLTKYAGNYEE